MPRILTVYFSRKGQNYWNGSLKVLTKGNTELAAEFVQGAVGGELFEIETVRAYSDDYQTCCEEAQKELREGIRPALKFCPADLSMYEILFVGFPNWWGTLPMAVTGFLEQYDLSGKTVVPFCTNEGSGMGASERDLRKVCKGATILPGLSVRGSRVAAEQGRIEQWAKHSVV